MVVLVRPGSQCHTVQIQPRDSGSTSGLNTASLPEKRGGGGGGGGGGVGGVKEERGGVSIIANYYSTTNHQTDICIDKKEGGKGKKSWKEGQGGRHLDKELGAFTMVTIGAYNLISIRTWICLY